MKHSPFVTATTLFLAVMSPIAAFAGCLVITDISPLQPLDAGRLVSKTANGGGSVLTVVGCAVRRVDASIVRKGDLICEGDTISVDRQQCFVKSIQSIAARPSENVPSPPAGNPNIIQDVAPLLQRR